MMETAVKELGGGVCDGDCSERVRGGVCDGDCSERVRGGLCVGDCSQRVRGWCVLVTAVKELGGGDCNES